MDALSIFRVTKLPASSLFGSESLSCALLPDGYQFKYAHRSPATAGLNDTSAGGATLAGYHLQSTTFPMPGYNDFYIYDHHDDEEDQSSSRLSLWCGVMPSLWELRRPDEVI